MTTKKFHKKTITLEFLSEEPIPEGMDVANMVYEAQEGDYVMQEKDETDTELTGKEAADLLTEFGSQPEFFGLDDDGNDLDDDDDDDENDLDDDGNSNR